MVLSEIFSLIPQTIAKNIVDSLNSGLHDATPEDIATLHQNRRTQAIDTYTNCLASSLENAAPAAQVADQLLELGTVTLDAPLITSEETNQDFLNLTIALYSARNHPAYRYDHSVRRVVTSLATEVSHSAPDGDPSKYAARYILLAEHHSSRNGQEKASLNAAREILLSAATHLQSLP